MKCFLIHLHRWAYDGVEWVPSSLVELPSYGELPNGLVSIQPTERMRPDQLRR